jgi:TPR repeat protein
MKLALTHAIGAILLMLSSAAPVAAGPFEDSVAEYDRGDYENAYRLLVPLAEQGVAKAQVNLGLMYFYGQAVPQNDIEAEKWFRKAADQGDAFAEHNLGVMYANGWGLPVDLAEAAKWYQRAADLGLSDAQYDLGLMYAKGQGVPQDYVRARMWLNLSAAQGNKDAVGETGRIARVMTRSQIAEADKLAREWKPTKQPPR